MRNLRFKEFRGCEIWMTAAEFSRKRRFDLNAIVFIVSMAIALRYNRESLAIRNIGYAIDLFWIALAAVTLLRMQNKSVEKNSDYKPLALKLLLPKILIWAYGAFLTVVGLADAEAFSTGFTVLATFVLPMSALFLFRAKTVDYVFWANLITFLFEVCMILIQSGPSALMAAIASIGTADAINPFEHYSWTFLSAFFLVYYTFFVSDEELKYRWVYQTVSIVMFILGFKRILLAAVIVVAIILVATNRVQTKNGIVLLRSILVIIGLGCILMVWGLYNGWLFDLLASSGINMMGRTIYWRHIINMTSFNIAYLGNGVNWTYQWLSNNLYYLGGAGALHNDILKMYVEIGFPGFLVWLYLFLWAIPSFIQKRYGFRALKAYAVFTAMMFIIYATDNVDTYYGPQFLYISFVVTQAMLSKVQNTEAGRIPARGFSGRAPLSSFNRGVIR